MLLVPFTHLVLSHNEIGLHRGRRWGFRDIFGFRTLYNLPFLKLAARVKSAYEGRDVPKHEGWPAQCEALRWLVDKGSRGIYELDEGPIQIRYTPHQRYYICDGNHRALALYVIGDRGIRAQIKH